MIPRRTFPFVVSIVALGVFALGVAIVREAEAALAPLALLAAAALLAEIVQIPGDEGADDPLEENGLSFSSAVQIAGILVLGAWAAAAVAAFAVLVVDSLRGGRLIRNLFNASVFVLASLAGGTAFAALGGSPGSISLHDDLAALVALVVAYAAVNTGLVGTVTALAHRAPVRAILTDTVRADSMLLAAEGALGATVGYFVIVEPWGIVLLLPLAVAVYLSHSRLALLHRETARSLTTFASVIDERDPYTFRHSARVADYVGDLAEAVGLAPSVSARLRWAGRLHDLGKITVDARTLRKPTSLDEDEWAALRKHPRVSARILRRFRFAAEEARAVEYHHERHDGKGYYGIRPEEIPLASHFLIVADSYDAMTSDRPYRAGLTPEAALAEIEAGLGTHFHPTVGKAFVAAARGLDLTAALSDEELAEVRRVRVGRSPVALLIDASLREPSAILVLGGVLASVALIGLGLVAGAVAGPVCVLAGIAWRRVDAGRARRLAAAAGTIAAQGADRVELFSRLVERIGDDSTPSWAGLLDAGGASLAAEWRPDGRGPSTSALAGWVAREGEPGRDWFAADGEELGDGGRYVALVLTDAGSGGLHLVLGFDRRPPRHLEAGLRLCAEELRQGLAPPPAAPLPLVRVS